MAEREFGIEEGRTLIMAALESAKGVVNAYEICCASDRLFGVALAGGDFRKDMRVKVTESGIDIMVARGMMLLAARAAGVQCFDTNFADFKNMEGFENEVRQNHQMGFDGKSIINPRQIRLVHQVFTPSAKEVDHAERLVRAYNEQASAGVGVFTFEGKMVDIAHVRDAQDLLKLAKASGVYHGDL